MNPIQPGASIQEMARSLMRTVDSNGNGELSTEEFTSFLAKLMTGVQTGLSASRPRDHRGHDAGAAATGASLSSKASISTRAPTRPSRPSTLAAAAQRPARCRPQGRGRDRSTPASRARWRSSVTRSTGEGRSLPVSNWQGTFVVD